MWTAEAHLNHLIELARWLAPVEIEVNWDAGFLYFVTDGKTIRQRDFTGYTFPKPSPRLQGEMATITHIRSMSGPEIFNWEYVTDAGDRGSIDHLALERWFIDHEDMSDADTHPPLLMILDLEPKGKLDYVAQ